MYLKVLQSDGTSLNGPFKYPLPVNGQPSDWIDVPGNGAYLAHSGGLFAGGEGPVIAVVEPKTPEQPVCESGIDGVECHSPVRVTGAWLWADAPPTVVLAAIKQDGWVTRYLTDAQRTTTVVLAAMKQRGYPVKWIAAARRKIIEARKKKQQKE